MSVTDLTLVLAQGTQAQTAQGPSESGRGFRGDGHVECHCDSTRAMRRTKTENADKTFAPETGAVEGANEFW